ncbi:MAG: nuclear transport factor 2 family protein [Thermoleophilia bacterium]
MSTPSPAARYLELLVAGRVEDVATLFVGDPLVDDPLVGRVRGRAELARLVRHGHGWLDEAAATIEDVVETRAPERAVAEATLGLVLEGGAVDLPVCVVADLAGGGATALRVYHSTWPLSGAHAVRPQLLPGREVELPPPVDAYQAALAAGDVEAIVACFEPDGAFREPAGGAYRHVGRAGLARGYADLLATGGGIPLVHCTVTDDGSRCAVEYAVVRWGPVELPPQAGVAVYERGGTGLLREARVYDDVDPPAS